MVMARAWHPTSPQQVHRIVYETWKGPVPAGCEVSHLCDVRHCVNPAHLVAESHAANMARIPAERRGPRRSRPPLSEVGAGGRLTHTVARYLELNPRRRSRHPTELIAARIRADGGDVWGAVLTFGVSYSHACRIKRGWRPEGRRAERIERAA